MSFGDIIQIERRNTQIRIHIRYTMTKSIKITKKNAAKGDDGHKIISVRIKEEMLTDLDGLAAKTNRSRNELINIVLVEAM